MTTSLGEGRATDRHIQELLSKRNFSEAESLIRTRMKNEPNSADAHYFLGVMYYFQSKVPSAVEELKKALTSDPKHTDAAICLSVLLNDIGKYGDAKKVFEQANHSVSIKKTGNDTAIDRKFAIKHLEIADLYYRYRRYDEAIDEYTRAIHLDPATVEIRIRRAKAYAKKGFVTRSMQELQQLKKERSDYIPARIQLGLLHYSQGNILDAELEWEAVLAIDATHREATAYLEMAKKGRSLDASLKLI